MPESTTVQRTGIRLGAAALLLALAACSNTYGPPVEGQPLTAGQQHYLDNQRYQQINLDRFRT